MNLVDKSEVEDRLVSDTENRQELTGRDIKELITSVTVASERCGFEVFVITKSEPCLKKIAFYEDSDNNLRLKLKQSILNTLSSKYNAEDAEYVSADRIADKQKKFYIIETSDDYDPLGVLKTEATAGVFNKADISDVRGIAFSIRNGGKQLWAYQHLWPIMVPNKSKRNFMARLISQENEDVFEEFVDPIIAFSEKIDLLIIDKYIITSDYKLLQNSFGFQDYICVRADKAIQTVADKGIVANIEKLRDYVQRGNGTLKYAKKMMRIKDSKVLEMEPEQLWENIHKSNRWNGKIKEEEGKFVLNHFSDVENLIDLLDERYTRSDITGTEYDTDVKEVAEAVELTGGNQHDN